MRDTMKMVKSLEDTGLLINGISQKNEIVTKEQRGGYLSLMVDTLGASLLKNI